MILNFIDEETLADAAYQLTMDGIDIKTKVQDLSIEIPDTVSIPEDTVDWLEQVTTEQAIIID